MSVAHVDVKGSKNVTDFDKDSISTFSMNKRIQSPVMYIRQKAVSPDCNATSMSNKPSEMIHMDSHLLTFFKKWRGQKQPMME